MTPKKVPTNYLNVSHFNFFQFNWKLIFHFRWEAITKTSTLLLNRCKTVSGNGSGSGSGSGSRQNSGTKRRLNSNESIRTVSRPPETENPAKKIAIPAKPTLNCSSTPTPLSTSMTTMSSTIGLPALIFQMPPTLSLLNTNPNQPVTTISRPITTSYTPFQSITSSASSVRPSPVYQPPRVVATKVVQQNRTPELPTLQPKPTFSGVITESVRETHVIRSGPITSVTKITTNNEMNNHQTNDLKSIPNLTPSKNARKSTSNTATYSGIRNNKWLEIWFQFD